MAKSALPVNPETGNDPEQAALNAAAQSSGEVLSDGNVYVTRSVPNLVVVVNPGQHVRVPEGHEVAEAGDYYGVGTLDDDGNERAEAGTFVTHGPTAHMLEARGFVTVTGVAA